MEKRAVDKFFEKFVLFPCNSSSSSGFLEQLPMLFEEVQTEGRVGLRWAVRAASFASLNNEQGNEELERKASVCYGKALEALGDSLRNKEEAVSDYTLMTVVMLDLFEVSISPPPLILLFPNQHHRPYSYKTPPTDVAHTPKEWLKSCVCAVLTRYTPRAAGLYTDSRTTACSSNNSLSIPRQQFLRNRKICCRV